MMSYGAGNVEIGNGVKLTMDQGIKVPYPQHVRHQDQLIDEWYSAAVG